MSNRNLGNAAALFLAFLIVPAGGCDSRAAASSADEPTRYRVDAARHRVWLLTRDGVIVDDAAAPEKIAVPLPDWQWVRPPYGCLPDFALGPEGEAVVTSNVVPTLWRIDPETLAVSVHPLALDVDLDKDVGFSRIAYSPGHGAFFAVGNYDGALWRIDPLLATARKLAPQDRPAVALGPRPVSPKAVPCPQR
jgi:hypothetical protein